MACPRVVFQASGRGPTAQAAIRDVSNRAVGLAWQFCSTVDARCPEPGITPLEAELLAADVVEGAVQVRMRFTFQCNAPGAGCLSTPFMAFLSQRDRSRHPGSDVSLEELLTSDEKSAQDSKAGDKTNTRHG